MSRFKHYLAALVILALIFTSCSKEEGAGDKTDATTASLTFGPILNDLMAKGAETKQGMDDLPECTDGTPDHVMIVLSQDGTDIVGTMGDPFRVDLVEGQLFTEDAAELELEPGTYSLDYFGVYTEAGELLWLAPTDGLLGEYLDNPLPLSLNLGAGAKKYVEVSVLCFDNRVVNEYGYLFFDIEGTEAIEFCIFGNYCDDAGRHYPAEFSIDVWSYANGEQGDLLVSDAQNSVTLDENGDYAGSSVCMVLPDSDGEDEYYFEISLLNSDAYPDVTEEVIRSGVVTDAEVRELFEGETNMEYYHFREGACDMADSPDLFGDEADTGTE